MTIGPTQTRLSLGDEDFDSVELPENARIKWVWDSFEEEEDASDYRNGGIAYAKDTLGKTYRASFNVPDLVDESDELPAEV